MEFSDVVRGRRMIRRYDPNRLIDRDEVEILLKLAIRAPSAGYTQGWRFLVLDDITSRDLFWTTASTGPSDTWRSGMSTAPVLVVCFADRGAYLERYAQPDKTARSSDSVDDRDPRQWPVPYWDVDTGMAALLLMLSAHDRGLGAGFFGIPGARWEAVARAFAVPDGLRPVGVVSIGHPASTTASAPSAARSGRPARRSLREVVSYNSFDGDGVPARRQS